MENYNEEIERNLYLRELLLGNIQGPLTGIPNIDRPWLKYYTKEELMAGSINKTVYRYLYDENKKYINDTAIIFANRKIKYFELFLQIEKVAKALKTIGVKKGEVVTICLPNTPESAYLFYACSMIGAIADYIDPTESEEGLEKYLNISNPRHLIMLDMCFDKFTNLIEKKNIENIVVTSPVESLPLIMNGLKIKNKISDREIYNRHKKVMRESPANYMFYKDFIKNGNMYNGVLEEEYEKDRPVAIVHTGGTTGVPKGVLLSNDNLNELTNQIKNSPVQFIRHYLLVGVMPEFVGYGLSVGLHTSLVCGMKTMMIAKYEPEKIPEVILKYKPNCMAGSPAHWEIFSKSPLINRPNVDLSFFKAPIEGGDTLNAKVESKVNEILDKGGCKYKIQKGYGLTEKCSAVTVCFNNEVNKPGSVGVPFSKTVVSIYDNDKKEDLHYNELGEICVSAPDIMLGYYGNIEETDKVIQEHQDGNKWLHTGDIGYVTPDGLLYVVGRIKDIIIRYDGKKIYPYNVENILLKCPIVKSVAVVGIPDPNHYNGEVPVAFVSIDDSYSKEEAMKIISDYANNTITDYLIPTSYYIEDELPKTVVGKVDKKVLKKTLIRK